MFWLHEELCYPSPRANYGSMPIVVNLASELLNKLVLDCFIDKYPKFRIQNSHALSDWETIAMLEQGCNLISSSGH